MLHTHRLRVCIPQGRREEVFAVAMGLEISELMRDSKSDYALEERFTSLESIVTPVLKPDDQAVLQIFDIYEVQNALTDTKQVRLMLSDSMYLQEAVLAPELIEAAKCDLITKGSIVRILKYDLHASVSHELKRIIRILNLEVIVADFRLVGNPSCISWEEWKEEDWDEDTWEWLDPEEQEWVDPDEPCGFLHITETISTDAIAEINTNCNAEQLPAIVLQIVDISSTDTPTEEYKIILSDGVHLQHAVLAAGLNDKIRNNLAVNGSIVFLYEYKFEIVENRRIISVLDMQVLEVNAEIVGNPKELPTDYCKMRGYRIGTYSPPAGIRKMLRKRIHKWWVQIHVKLQ